LFPARKLTKRTASEEPVTGSFKAIGRESAIFDGLRCLRFCAGETRGPGHQPEKGWAQARGFGFREPGTNPDAERQGSDTSY
jgi:hypothetical protein